MYDFSVDYLLALLFIQTLVICDVERCLMKGVVYGEAPHALVDDTAFV